MPRIAIELTIPRARAASRCPRATGCVRDELDRRGPRRRASGPTASAIASPLRMLFGLAEQFNQHRFERAAEDVWHRGLVTPDQAGDYLAAIRRSGRTGVIRMETWLERTSFRTTPPTASRAGSSRRSST